MILFPVIYAILSTVCLYFTIWVYRLDPRAALNRAAAISFLITTLWLATTGFTVAAPNEEAFWLSLRIEATVYYALSPPLLLYLFIVTRVPLLLRMVLVLPGAILALVFIYFVWTGNWTIGGYHTSPWGNVYHGRSDPLVSFLGTVRSLFDSAAAFGCVIWAGVRTTSRRYRRLLLELLLLGAYAGLWGLFAAKVLWQTFGLPDMFSLGAVVPILWYCRLTAVYRHLLEDQPDVEAQLLGQLRGITLFCNQRGLIVRTSNSAQSAFGKPLVGRPLKEVAPSWLTVIDPSHADHSQQASPGESGPLGLAQYRVNWVQHRNLFGEPDGYMVRFVPLTPLDEKIAEHGISGREKEVALLAAQGLEPQQIAETLFITVGTVRNHLHRLYNKTKTKGRAELTRVLLSWAPERLD